jgi:hypothetical protein
MVQRWILYTFDPVRYFYSTPDGPQMEPKPDRVYWDGQRWTYQRKHAHEFKRLEDACATALVHGGSVCETLVAHDPI